MLAGRKLARREKNFNELQQAVEKEMGKLWARIILKKHEKKQDDQEGAGYP